MVIGLFPAISATAYGELPSSTIREIKLPQAEYQVTFSLIFKTRQALESVRETNSEICFTRV